MAYVGSWSRGTSGSGKYGVSYRSDGNTGPGSKEAIFTPTLPVTGLYEVTSIWPSGSNRSAFASYVLRTLNNGSTNPSTVWMDQTTNPGLWNFVANAQFAAGYSSANGRVSITNQLSSDGAVIADAVRWTLLTAAPASAPIITSVTPGQDQLTVKWSPVVGATSYKLYGISANPVIVTGTTYVHTIGVGNTVTYTVKASNAGGDSAASAPVSGSPIFLPSAPAISSIVPGPGSGQITLNWSPVSGAASYKLYRSTASGQTGYAVPLTVTSPYTDTGLAIGTTYYYTLKATNASGDSPASDEASTSTFAPPSAPTGLTATAGVNQITLDWTALANTTYKLYRSTTSGQTGSASPVTVTAPYPDNGLTAGVTYYYTLKASNPVGDSPASAQVSAVPLAPPVPPSAPTGLTATAGNGQILLKWTSIAGLSYKLYRSTVSGQTGSSNPIAVTSPYINPSLVNGTTYYYTLKASNAGGDSPASSQVSAIPVAPAAPSPPTITGLTVTGNSSGGYVSLTWGSTNCESFSVFRNTTNGFLNAEFRGSTAANSFIDNNITTGTYYYFVKGYSAYGDTVISNILPVTISGTGGTLPSVGTVKWFTGAPISCQGIAYPSNTLPIAATLKSGMIGRLNAHKATDLDVIGRYEATGWVYEETSDPCIYTWTINGVSTTGQTVRWQAPVVSVDTNYTVQLTVDDGNGLNLGNGATGSRNDSVRTFSTIITVTH